MAKNYDLIFKENIDAMYLSLSELVLKHRPIKISDVNLEIQKTIERYPDFLKKVQSPNSNGVYLLHIEIQTSDDSEMLYRMHEYHSLLFRKFKTKIVQIVIYIGEGISRMTNYYEDDDYKISYNLFSLQNISYQVFLDSDKPEELLLAILANFENLSPEIIIEKILFRAQLITNETFSLDKFVSQFEEISKLRKLENTFKTIIDKVMPLQIKMEETYIFKKGEEKGEKRGEKRGIKNTKTEAIAKLLKIAKLSIEEIAISFDVSVNFVKKIQKEMLKD